MAIVNLCGWETGDTLEMSYASGVNVQNSVARQAGGYALQVNPGMGGGGYGELRGLAAGAAADADVINSYIRFYFRTGTSLGMDTPYLFSLRTSSDALKMALKLNPSGYLCVLDAMGTTVGTGSTALSTNTWYRLGILAGSGVSASYALTIDGSSELSGTADLSTDHAARVRLGPESGLAFDSADFYYDDFHWDDSVDPGVGRVQLLLPNGDGYVAQGTANGAASKWRCLYERPNDGDATYVNGLSDTQKYLAAMDAGGYGFSVACVKMMAVVRRDGGSDGSMSLIAERPSLAAATTWGPVATTSSYQLIAAVSDTDPNSVAWTMASLDELQLGVVENSGSPSRVTAIYGMLAGDLADPIVRPTRRQRQRAARFPSPLVVW